RPAIRALRSASSISRMLFLSLLLPGPGHTPEFIPKGTEWPGAVTAANVHDSVAAPELGVRGMDEPGRERKPTRSTLRVMERENRSRGRGSPHSRLGHALKQVSTGSVRNPAAARAC